MPTKLLITTGLLFVSLAASVQAESRSHPYQEFSFAENYQSEFTQHFNDSHQSPAKKQWLLIAQQGYISKAQAIDIARQRSNGKILSAKLVKQEQHAFYKIKVLTDQGRIKTLHINAIRR